MILLAGPELIAKMSENFRQWKVEPESGRRQKKASNLDMWECQELWVAGNGVCKQLCCSEWNGEWKRWKEEASKRLILHYTIAFNLMD